MKPIFALLILTVFLSLDAGAQDVRSKVGAASETSVTNIIDPDNSLYGVQWGCSEDEFINKFGSPTGYIRLNNSDTVMLYGKGHAFIFTTSKLSGVRITFTVFDGNLSRSLTARTPFDIVNWQLSNGVRKGMNLAETKKILGDSLKLLHSQTYYFNSNKTRIQLDFAHPTDQAESDETYRIFGIYIRQLTSSAIPSAPLPAGPRISGIPAATRPCSNETATWWEALRTAVTEVVEIKKRMSESMALWYQTHRGGSDSNAGQSNKELAKLKADLAIAAEKYRQLLAEGRAKSYRPPIQDSDQPLAFHLAVPGYTEQARKNKISGKVSMRVEFRSDGTIGEVQIVSGLKDGLDEQAIKSAREILFLPGVKDEMFVTMWKPLETEFNVR